MALALISDFLRKVRYDMKFYEYGKENSRKIMLLHGNMVTHRQFENIVPLLEKKYHVITVDFDGFDETGETVYTTAKEQAEKLAAYIKEKLDGRIDLLQAESLGSAPAVFLTTFKDISTGGVILSGAQYLDMGVFNHFFMLWAPRFSHNMINGFLEKGEIKFPKFLERKMGRRNEEFGQILHQAAKNTTIESYNNTFLAGLLLYREIKKFPVNDKIPLSCWYGENEKNMKRAVKELSRAFTKFEDRPFKNMGHGSIVGYPELMAESMERFMRDNNIVQ